MNIQTYGISVARATSFGPKLSNNTGRQHNLVTPPSDGDTIPVPDIGNFSESGESGQGGIDEAAVARLGIISVSDQEKELLETNSNPEVKPKSVYDLLSTIPG